MTVIKTPQSRCRVAVSRCDITPPVGIYHRMWGAAMHDRATGVHRSLEATLLWMEPMQSDMGPSRILVALDHCILDTREIEQIRTSIHDATHVGYENIMITLSHTHGSGWMSRTRSHLPGGELIGPYLDQLAVLLADLAKNALARLEAATIVYGTGRCNLATHRDFFDESIGKFVCGLNLKGQADDVVLFARISNECGETLATIVNYACHPTTLAWDNTLISPDWVGAMREVVEQHQGGICMFIQGASGDLGPQEGFVGDPTIADRNGRQLGYAVLSGLIALPRPGTEYTYLGPVVSGTAIGTWQHRSQSKIAMMQQERWLWKEIIVELPYRHDLPTMEETISDQEHWSNEESKARQMQNESRVRECRAQVEQCTRQINRLSHLTSGKVFPLHVHIGIMGEAVWILVPGELYQEFQRLLRARFSDLPVIIGTLTNDWQPGYIPPANCYGYGIYQEVIAATSPGCMEILCESVDRELRSLFSML